MILQIIAQNRPRRFASFRNKQTAIGEQFPAGVAHIKFESLLRIDLAVSLHSGMHKLR